MINTLGIVLLWSFSAWCFAAADPPAHRWQMQLGSSRDLEVPAGSVLRLNQKKVIEIEELGATRFRLLALRSGHVYLRALDSESRLLASWMIEVLPEPTSRSGDRLLDKSWENYFCSEAGVTCDRERFLIRGQTHSLVWLHEARRQCEKQVPCRFEVSLAPQAREKWEEQLRRELLRPDLLLGADGFVQIEIVCGPKREAGDESLQKQLEERYGLALLTRCRERSLESFDLELLAVADRSQSSDKDNPLRWEGLALPLGTELQAIVQSLSEEGRAQIIAQPQVQLAMGGQLVIADGLEIETIVVQDERSASVWKAVGFQLSCALLEEKAGQIHMKVDMRLSRPRGETLDSSQLQTELWVAVSRWQLLGRIQARSEGRDTAHIPWLAQIPLIGALFKWDTQQKAQSDISLFARLRPAATDEKKPPPLSLRVQEEGA